MEIFSHESDGEDSLIIASKEWNRVTDAAKKTGYREGVEDGSNVVFQKGFDEGYKQGFDTGFILGKFQSLLNVMPQDAKNFHHVNEILDQTGKGVCRICKTEAEGSDNTQTPFSEIVTQQRTHSAEVLRTLHRRYFEPYSREINICESDILKIQDHVPALEER